MASFSLLRLFLLSLTHAAAQLQPSDHSMFSTLGGRVTLPCGIPSIQSCSSINWSVSGVVESDPQVVRAGRVTAPNALRLRLLKDCSLEIRQLLLNDARLYSCDNGALNSSVSLRILKVIESSTAENDIELECFLSTYVGLGPCNTKGVHIKWTTEDGTPLKGGRFHPQTHTDCFSKLTITKKQTDHHRKWKCQLFQNDTLKATVSYTTTVKDGIEEVFTAVSESVSLSCSSTSSLRMGGSVTWAVGERPLTDDISPCKGRCHVNRDSSLVISKVSALHAGEYRCSESAERRKVLNRIWLHTLDVTSERGPGGDNLTLTCVLTCSKECEKDFNLTWSEGGQASWQSGLLRENNTLIKRIFVPVLSTASDELTCTVRREGAVVASKKRHTVNPLQTPAWLALPLGLLICITAGGLWVYMKRKHNKDAGNDQSSIGMTHVYDVIDDENNEEQHQQGK
ncbi:uncharacterized protein LOC115567845 isoform X2 [Sparus aurata]|uniref:uncharacterized protein LOC115567845 isoform X2 n=1 Tax=Sparus aurata TaxID=8175 RepID=UPI0011C16A23|nr:uncharacterized protein LOC115567845 isoform X2 [Sparus aurata]